MTKQITFDVENCGECIYIRNPEYGRPFCVRSASLIIPQRGIPADCKLPDKPTPCPGCLGEGTKWTEKDGTQPCDMCHGEKHL